MRAADQLRPAVDRGPRACGHDPRRGDEPRPVDRVDHHVSGAILPWSPRVGGHADARRFSFFASLVRHRGAGAPPWSSRGDAGVGNHA